MIPLRLAIMLAAALMLLASSEPSQVPRAPDPLDRLGFLIGRWEGTADGQPGKATVRREYARALSSKFIRAVHRGEYPPQEKNPKGEIHEHRSFFSFDNARKTVVFRQFHQEGFVNQYVLEPTTKPGTLVFVSEALENIPRGYKARETYTLIGADEFEEVFEIAEPGKDFVLYSKARLKRVP